MNTLTLSLPVLARAVAVAATAAVHWAGVTPWDPPHKP